jgi:hypothetical protein
LDTELAEVAIRPSGSALEDIVQIVDATVTADEQTPSRHRADAEHDYLELIEGENGAG